MQSNSKTFECGLKIVTMNNWKSQKFAKEGEFLSKAIK